MKVAILVIVVPVVAVWLYIRWARRLDTSTSATPTHVALDAKLRPGFKRFGKTTRPTNNPHVSEARPHHAEQSASHGTPAARVVHRFPEDTTKRHATGRRRAR